MVFQVQSVHAVLEEGQSRLKGNTSLFFSCFQAIFVTCMLLFCSMYVVSIYVYLTHNVPNSAFSISITQVKTSALFILFHSVSYTESVTVVPEHLGVKNSVGKVPTYRPM